MGRGLDGTVTRVVENLVKLGHKKVILRFDQEPAILELIAGVIAAREDSTTPKNSPVGESQSNGLVERAVRSSKDQVRTLRLAVQKRGNMSWETSAFDANKERDYQLQLREDNQLQPRKAKTAATGVMHIQQ